MALPKPLSQQAKFMPCEKRLRVTLQVLPAPSGGVRLCSWPGTPAGAPPPLAATQMDQRVSAYDVALQMQWFGKGAKENLPSQMRSVTEVLWVHPLHPPLLVLAECDS